MTYLVQLYCKIFLALAVGKPFLQKAEGILRNPVTDRCISLGYNPAIRRDGLSVFADECSWTDDEKGEQGNRDQWLQVIPVQNDRTQHKIQKFSPDALFCVHTASESSRSEITVGNCRSESSVFLFKPLQNLSSLNEPRELFTIEQPAGKCVTIEPGSMKLILENCTRGNAFQKWIACRHIKACDVEISWSPSRIIFPTDPFNSSSDFQPEEIEIIGATLVEPLAQLSETKTVAASVDDSPRMIINEPIYFIYNALKMGKLSERELVQVVSDFYTMEELKEALEVLNSRFALEIDPRSRSVKIPQQLIVRVKQVLIVGQDSGVIFVSKNLARVPLTVSKSQVDLGQNCPKLGLTNDRVRMHLALIQKALGDLKSVVEEEFKTSNNHSESSSGGSANPGMKVVDKIQKDQTSTESEEGSEDDGALIQNIDIRIRPSKKKHPKVIKVDPVKPIM